MKHFIDKPETFRKIEFWAATTIFIFLVFFHISDALNVGVSSNRGTAQEIGNPFNFYFVSRLIRYTVLYLSFLALNFVIVPKLVKKEALFLNILIVILIFLIIGVVFGSTDTFLKYQMLNMRNVDRATHIFTFQNSFLYAFWLILMIGFYSVIKYTGLYLLSRSEAIHSEYRFITPGGLAAFVLWMLSMFFLIIGNAEKEIIGIWAVFIPSAILLYWYSFYSLLPKALSRKKPFLFYMTRIFLLVVVSSFPIGFLAFAIVESDAGAAISMFNAAFQFFIIAPICWVLYKRKMQGKEEVYTLQKELGRSHANFDFLRSQINPHFLFNALNTIYGTAIQEKAERTSEGIERLGGMMRFMLQENMQEKISLAREIEYLNNYISLQRLRTDPNPVVKIEADIQEQVNAVQIAPMLLIPFVENAFKHGISLREPSHIKVTLEMKDDTLYFDVYNSKHQRLENDPERDKSGIGLNNVRQRLNLLYPSRHELIIRETGKEFFVHLTIQLS